MALEPASISALILSAAGSAAASHNFPKVAQATANAFVMWLPIGVQVQGFTVGVVGAGTVKGKSIVVGPTGVMAGTFVAAGLVGRTSSQTALAIETGVANGVNGAPPSTGAQYRGVSVGVAVGVDKSQVIGTNAPLLIGLLNTQLKGLGIVGQNAVSLSIGIGNGLAALMLTGTGLGAVIPVTAGPYPSAGTSKSIIH